MSVRTSSCSPSCDCCCLLLDGALRRVKPQELRRE